MISWTCFCSAVISLGLSSGRRGMRHLLCIGLRPGFVKGRLGGSEIIEPAREHREIGPPIIRFPPVEISECACKAKRYDRRSLRRRLFEKRKGALNLALLMSEPAL